MSATIQALVYLVSTVFDLYLLMLCIRFILAFERANYFNPFTRFIITITQPLVAPLRRIIPNFRRYEWACLLWILIFEGIKFTLLTLLLSQEITLIDLGTSIFLATLRLFLTMFCYAIIIFTLLSWVQSTQHPAMQVLGQLTAPVLRPLRRFIPFIAGVDITPLIAIIIIQTLLIYL